MKAPRAGEAPYSPQPSWTRKVPRASPQFSTGLLDNESTEGGGSPRFSTALDKESGRNTPTPQSAGGERNLRCCHLGLSHSPADAQALPGLMEKTVIMVLKARS